MRPAVLLKVVLVKCPYCAEEINEAAVVCHHCGRDFSLFIPMQKELIALRGEVAEVKGGLGRIAGAIDQATSNDRQASVALGWHYAMAGLLGILLAGLSFELSEKAGTRDDTLASIAALLFLIGPILSGVWLGLVVPAVHLRAYSIIGVVVGSATYGELALAKEPVGSYWPYVIWGILTIVTGGLIGDVIERMTSSRRSPSRIATAVAGHVLRAIPGNAAATDANIKRLAEVLAALGPLLTLAGTIYTARAAHLGPR